MGNCAPIRSQERTVGLPGPTGEAQAELQYSKSARVSIKIRNQSLDVIDRDIFVFQVTSAVLAQSTRVNFAGISAWISGKS